MYGLYKCIYLKEEQHLDSMLHQNYMFHNEQQRCDYHGQLTCKQRYESKQVTATFQQPHHELLESLLTGSRL